jgi:O-acetyl-ADP-ribose deacetylase (regulator of RNase III)
MNHTLKEYTFPSGLRLEVGQGDVTEEHVDAVVNAGNRHLEHGSGVAGAIRRKGGEVVERESREWVREHGTVSHGKPAYTHAGNLPCKFVIHAVGPVWGEGDEDEKLAAAISGSLRVANELGLQSMALPAISTGIYGFPKDRAARIILGTIKEYAEKGPETGLKLIRVVLFDLATLKAFIEAWEQDDHLGA